MLRIWAEQLFDGELLQTNVVMVIAEDRVVGFDKNISDYDHHISDLIAPGFIDIQVNGGGGILFNRATNIAELKQLFLAHAKFGTTAMLPTVITDTFDVMLQAANLVAEAKNNHLFGIAGIHFEGPHLAPAKKGAHSENFIRPISEQEWQLYQRQDIGQIVLTIAPENVATDDIKKLVKLGVKVCLGHSNASFECAQKACDAGADGFTHLYNAMSGLQARSPGLIGAALLNDNAYCGLILDGHHVDIAAAKLALKCKPQGKLLLVTDAMPPVGTALQTFDFFDRQVHLHNGKLIASSGELAGSVLDMATAVRNGVNLLDIPMTDALKMASTYPACFIKQSDQRGYLKVGYLADFVILNQELKVVTTYLHGEPVV